METRNKIKYQLVLVLIIVIITIVYVVFIKPNYYKFNGGNIYFEPVRAERVVYDESYDIYAYDGFLYISSSNGLKKVDQEGVSVWDKIYAIKDPKLITCGQYLCVIDIGGHIGMLFDQDGFLFEMPFEEKILMANVSEKGNVAFLLEEGNKHYIKTYTKNNEPISKTGTSFKNSGYPVEVELSSTGENLIVSYVETDHAKLQSEITLRNFGEAGMIREEKIIGGATYEDSLVSEIEFFDNENFVLLGDNIIDFYTLDYMPELVKTIEVTNEIKKISFGKDFLVVYYGDPLVATEDDMSNQVVVYTPKGKVISEYEMEKKVDSLIADGEYFYIAKEDALECYSKKKKIWQSEMYKEVERMFKIGPREFLIINRYGYEIIKIKDI